MGEPFFSIIIPTYNRAKILPVAIQSVIDQSFEKWELIIIDDGSVDNTKDVFDHYSDDRIMYFHKKHEERSSARNYGIELVNGEYVCFLDDDDYYLPGFLKRMLGEIQIRNHPKAIIRCAEYIQNKAGARTREKIPAYQNTNHVRFLWALQSSLRPFAIHKSLFINDRFKPGCHFGEDFHLLLRLAVRHPFYFIEDYLSVNVQHEDRGTNTKFDDNIRRNAFNSIGCFESMIQEIGYRKLKEFIPAKEINRTKNQIVYGFASAAMKKGDVKLMSELSSSLKWKGNFIRVLYYILSLHSRFIIKKVNSLIK